MGSAVEFSPIPAHVVAMRFRPDDHWTYPATPLMQSAESGYRDAAWSLLVGDVERARREARTARDMEFAYMARLGKERP